MAATANSEVINRLSREIADFPDRGKVAARQGFEIVSSLTEADRAKAVEAMLTSFERGGGSIDPQLRACPEITESTFDRVKYGFTTGFSYHMLWW